MTSISQKINAIVDEIKVNDIIFDRYIDKSEGKKGGEGVVYRVKIVDSKIKSALKIIPTANKNARNQWRKNRNMAKFSRSKSLCSRAT